MAGVDDNAGEDDDQDENENCEHGAQGRGAARLKVNQDGEARIKHAAVLASDAGSLTVDTPAGPVVVRIDDDTEVNGDLAAAGEVEIEGELEDDDSVRAAQIEVLCKALVRKTMVRPTTEAAMAEGTDAATDPKTRTMTITNDGRGGEDDEGGEDD